MVLSIGMIVKNEEKYLEECLTALQPILKELDSELIIADTGSTDRTVEIAKKFTDNVFHFEWINDFAAARNSTLEKARGEWYMFIDADEIVKDCAGLIRFFKSGEYKKFNAATYVVRSYADLSDRENYSDTRAQRMVSRATGAKFFGKVHEAFTCFVSPYKYLDLIADHYGYVFLDNGKDNGLAKQKNQRNLEYLFEEIKDETAIERNPSIYSEIADCYGIVNDEEKELEYLDLGLEKLDHTQIVIGQYYTHKILILFRRDDYQKIIEVANEFFDVKMHPWHSKELASDCYVYFARAYSYYRLKNYKSAISDITRCFDLYKKYNNNKLNTEDLMFDNFKMDPTMIKSGYDFFFRCCYQEKQFALANDYTNAIPLESYFDDQSFMINHLNIRIEMMENVGYNKLDTLYRRLDEFGKNYLLECVRRKVFVTTPQNRTMIIKKLSPFGGLPTEIAKIYSNYFDKGNADFGAISDFLKNHGSENGEDMLYILLENQMDISPFLLTEDFFADRAVQILMNYFPNGTELYEYYDIDKVSQDALVEAISLYGWIMRRALEYGRNISKFFKMYSDLGARWDTAFPNSLTVPGDVRAARLAGEVVAAKEFGDRAKFNIAIRNMTNVVPDLIPIANAYKSENGGSLRKVSVNPEFEQLAVQVKHNIRDLISARNISDARSLLKEFEGICPGDPDIEVLKKEINNTLQ